MNNFFKVIGIVLGAAVCCFAQESVSEGKADSGCGLKLGVGASWRLFEDTKIKGGAGGSSVWTRDRGAMIERIEIVSGGASAKMDVEGRDSFSPVLSLEYDFWKNDNLVLSLAANFQYFDLSNSRSVHLDTTETHSFTSVNFPEFGSVVGEVIQGRDSFKAKVDTSLYVIDLGLKASFSLKESFGFFAAFGPSLTFADMDAKVANLKDSDDDCVFGLYAAAGASFWITERIGLSGELRYDFAFDEAETKYAKQELDGFGAALKLVFAF